MFFRQPLHQKVKPALAAFGADAPAPARPVLDQFWETDQADDLLVRRVFQQAAGGPILIQPSEGATAFQDFAEAGFVEVVIPDVRQAIHGLHEMDYTLIPSRFDTFG